MKSFYELVEYFSGSRYRFTLENRIFNIACIVISILAILATIINLILQVNLPLIVLTGVSSVIFALFFYYTRYRGRFNELYLPFLFLINIISGILWFLNAGTKGPIAFGYMLLVTIAVIIGKKRDQFFLISLIIAMLIFLFYIEYNYPLSIIGYKDDKTRYFDFTSTMIIFIFLTSIIVRALKKNYDDERKSLENIQQEIHGTQENAVKIQKVLMLPPAEITKYFKDAFILSIPKETVSGDFYWVKKFGDKKYVVVADSTGKGVSVALMSILGISLINEIVSENQEIGAAEVLNLLRAKITTSLQREIAMESTKFDFDISLCIFDEKQSKLQFAGAGNPVYLIRNKKLERLDADRLPVSFDEEDMQYSQKTVDLKKEDRIYLFTDGYIDQFGGPNNKKFMSKQFKELLLEIHNKNMEEQKTELIKRFKKWKGPKIEQVDDILVFGITI